MDSRVRTEKKNKKTKKTKITKRLSLPRGIKELHLALGRDGDHKQPQSPNTRVLSNQTTHTSKVSARHPGTGTGKVANYPTTGSEQPSDKPRV